MSSLNKERNASSGVRRSKISKAFWVSGVMVLVILIPFIVQSPQTANAFAPGARPAKQSSTAEGDMPTYVASASNPTQAYQFTGLGLAQKFVPGAGHKIYTYFYINTAQTSQIPAGGIISELKFNVAQTTNNIYWFATNGQGKDFGTVGADIQISPDDGNPTLDQYVDVNFQGTLGNPHDSPLARCDGPTAGYPPSIDSGGEQREAIYTVVVNPSGSTSYIITGGMIIFRSNGEADMVFLINPQQTSHVSFDNVCSVPNLTFSSNEIDWAVRAPTPFNTIPGNYQEYPTTGGNLAENGGTAALTCFQFIDPIAPVTSSSTSYSSTSSTTWSSSSTTSTTTASSSSTSTTVTSTTASSSDSDAYHHHR